MAKILIVAEFKDGRLKSSVGELVAAARQQESGLTLRPAASENVQIPTPIVTPGARQPRQK